MFGGKVHQNRKGPGIAELSAVVTGAGRNEDLLFKSWLHRISSFFVLFFGNFHVCDGS